jgi:D-alanine-D-alanine ligase
MTFETEQESPVPQVVGIVYGGPSPEHDVSILTGLQAARALRLVEQVSEVHCLYWAKSGEWFEAPPDLEAADYLGGPPKGSTPLRLAVGAGGGFVARREGRLRWKEKALGLDAVLVCCHGGPGEDGTLQGVHDLCGISYTGPGLAAALLGMDKLAFSALMASAFSQMLPRVQLSADGPKPGFSGPYIVKPRYGGSSIGVEVVSDYGSALARLGANRHLERGAVIEPYRPDLYDLQIAVRTWPQLQLSAIERPIRASAEGEILDYSDKYVGPEGMASAPRELPAEVPEDVTTQIHAMTREVVSLCSVRGVARVDFLSDGGGVYLNEVNTIPGSLARHLFVEPEVPFEVLLADLLTEAVKGPTARFSTAGADGTVLRNAGSIAGKLA